MLDDQIRKIKLGYKILNDAAIDVHRMNSGLEPKYNTEIHRTRESGFNEKTDSWEGFGYLLGVAKNAIVHPKIIYKFYKS